ncbi:hypothetical protein MFFC18_03250 [Mariniblastus fucicola]|uniref:Uncharacterized protein n=1 Tax=Mariniblastus fucicola TaxID=980251 RepID=A0A5B9P1U4_9BACT|nr:hypothetical protein [Mariniblastus fucicola]QEG20477.1 hypothetical protein MFFC18_03250 [Mariniblastus fucicola]
MDGGDSFDGFEFNDELAIYDYVDSKANVKFDVVPDDWNRRFFFGRESAFSKLVNHDFLINRFKQSGAERGVDLESNIDDYFRELIFVHGDSGVGLEKAIF